MILQVADDGSEVSHPLIGTIGPHKEAHVKATTMGPGMKARPAVTFFDSAGRAWERDRHGVPHRRPLT